MLTPFLEDLILRGKARFKNWSYGVGSLGCLPVVTGQTCIIVDFTVDPFVCYLNEKNDPTKPSQINMQLLRIESGKTVNDYVLKWIINQIDTDIYRAEYMQKRFDCFIVNTNPVQVRIGVFPNESSWALVLNAPMGDAAEPSAPLGYNGSNVISSIDFGGQGRYNPMTTIHNKSVAGASVRDELNINFNQLTNPFIDPRRPIADQCPIINFSCVYIDENLTNLLLSSK